jgi:nitroreductase
METRDAILKRRSVRKFIPGRRIDDLVLKDLLEMGICAPSAGNRQPWKIRVIKDPGKRKKLAADAYGSSFVSEAPVVLVVCIDMARAKTSYGNRGVELYAIQDTAALIENILIAAADRDIGSCWVGAFDETRCMESIGAGKDLRPVAIIPLGYAAEETQKTGRRPLDEVIIWDK